MKRLNLLDSKRSTTSNEKERKLELKVVDNKDTSIPLSYDGKNFGNITYDGYKALAEGKYKPVEESENEKKATEALINYVNKNIQGDNKSLSPEIQSYINSPKQNIKQSLTEAVINGLINKKPFDVKLASGYTPVSAEEKKALDEFVNYTNKKAQEQEAKELEEYKNNPVFKRYGIDPTTFGFDEFKKWTEEHNYNFYEDDPNSASVLVPKKEGGFLGYGGKKLTTEQEDEDVKVLYEVFLSNARKQNLEKNADTTNKSVLQKAVDSLMTGGVSFTEGATLGGVSLASRIGDKNSAKVYKEAGLNEKFLTPSSQQQKQMEEQHPVASFLGELGGGLATQLGVGSLVRSGTKALAGKVAGKGVATLAEAGAKTAPKWLQWAFTNPHAMEAMNDGITFAITGATRTANAGGSAEDVLTSAGVNLLGGAVSGSLESVLGKIGTKLLTDKGLQNKIIPEIVRNATTNAIGGVAQNVTSYALYPEHMKPSARDFALDLAVDFAFGSIFTGIDAIDTSKKSKTYLDDLTTSMHSDYAKMIEAYQKGDGSPESIQQLANNVLQYTGVMKSYLTGKGVSKTIDGRTISFEPYEARFLGQDKYVKTLVEELDTISSRAKDYLEGNIKTAEADVPKTESIAPKTEAISEGTVKEPTPEASNIAPVNQNANQNVNQNIQSAEPTISPAPASVNKTETETPRATESINEPEETVDATFDESANKPIEKAVEAQPIIETPQANTGVKVGDTFVDTESGNTLRIVGRDDNKTTVEKTTADGEVVTQSINNNVVDKISNNPQYEPETEQPITEVSTSLSTMKNRASVPELFNSATKIVVGKDCVVSNSIAIPKTDELVNKLKSAKTKTNVEYDDSITMARFSNGETNVDILGDAKVFEKDKSKFYAFSIDDKLYVCEQKYLDHFNNGKNTIKAGENPQQIWKVFDENGTHIGSIMPTSAKRIGLTPEIFNGLQTVSETKTAKAKAVKANAPLSTKDLNAIKKWDRFVYQEENGNYYVSNGHILFVFDKAQADSAIAEWKSKNGAEPLKVNIFGSKFKELTSYESQGVVSEIKPASAEKTDKRAICVADGIGYLFDKNYADIANRHCKELRVLSNGSWTTTSLVGYDESGNANVMVLPLRNETETINGIKMFTAKKIEKKEKDSSDDLKKTEKSNIIESKETQPSEASTQDAQNASNLSENNKPEELPAENKSAVKTQNTKNSGNLSDDAIAQLEAREQKMQEVISRFGLTEDEAWAVLEYKTAEAYKINAKLREDESLLTETQKMIVELLDSALEKLPKHTGKTYRTVSFDDVFNPEEEYNAFLEQHVEGSGIIYNAYTSASALSDGHPMPDDTKHGVTLEIDGESGRDVDGFGNNFEKEIVFPRGLRFVVTEVSTDSKGRPYIKIKEIGENGRVQIHPEERSNILQQMQTEGELHTDVQKASQRNTERSGDTEKTLQRVRTDSEIKENENNVQKPEVLDGESGTDDRGLQSGTPKSDVEEGTERTVENGRKTSERALQSDDGELGNRPDVGNDSEGIRRGTDTGNTEQEAEGTVTDGRGRGRGSTERTGHGTDGRVHGVGAEPIDEAPEVIETVDKSIEKKRPSNKENFVITNDIASELDNNLPSAKDNMEAIELLLKLENEGRKATADEKKILAKYKGWGGVNLRTMEWSERQKLYSMFDYEQRKQMEDSGTNAFFTPTKVIDAMYNGLKQMGFKGGNVLETSMGTGNFFGRMPVAMSAKSALTGVELESFTARIAQYLYPGATVINKPFQDVVIKNGSYDLVIGNVPFGNEKLSYNGKKHSLHNYFIISSLDKVRDGGIVAVITSAGTLDSYAVDARSAIMDKADVVACYKLPAGVFSRNAKTDVQTDLLILRKRPSGAKAVGDSILNVTEKDGLRLNEYFVKHPENILGTLTKGTNAWGEITTVLNNGKFDELLTNAMKKLPKNLISGEVNLKPVETIVTTESKPKFFEKGGKIYADNGAGEAVAVPQNQTQTVKDYIAVRDAYKTMLDAYAQDLPESEIKPLRETLNKTYDNFFKKHTAISGDGKKKIGKEKSKNNMFLEADSDYYLLCGLERYNQKENKFEKSSVFTSDTLRKKKVTNVDTSSDALAISLNETGGIDFKMMSDLTGKSEQQLANELKGEIVYTPSGKHELIDIYLSGDIYAKLEEVKGKPEFKEQEEMLKKVLPTPKDASQITIKLGANYIDAEYIEDFAREVFDQRINVKKNSSGNWVIDGADRGRYGEKVNVKYGCGAFNAVQLLQKILNDADIVANKSVKMGDKTVSVFDKEMTDIALGKAQDIRNAFENWLFKDTNRRNNVVNKYNRMYNAVRPLDYENIASKLTFDSMNSTLKSRLYPHQRKGIARFLFGGNTLFAHGVGTGKTFEMIASVMEAKRMGIVNKTAMVVPNNKVVDFKRDIAEAYPNAKVLVIDTADKKRQTLLGLVNSNDWDIILIPRTTFTRIPVSAEMQKSFYNNQLEAINREVFEAQNDRNISKRQINSLILQRKNLEEKLKDLDKETERDVSVDFDKLGIDCICVDEAHNYKSVTTPSKLQIKGLVNKSDAQQANDMLMKLDYLRSVDGKIIFGTGTPITNTVSEIYNMIRMVRPDILESAGIHSLDEWVNTFAKVESKVEIDIDGKIKDKATKSIRSFINTKEMVAMFRQFADIVFTQDVVKDLPKGIYHSEKIAGTKEHKLIKTVVRDTLSSASAKEKLGKYGEMSGMLNASALDLRMLSGVDKESNPLKDYSPEELDYANSKINTMVGYIMKHYKESNDIKGTQIVFCDAGAGAGKTYTFNAHQDIKNKLVQQGIPENEIVIVKNQNDAKLEELYAQVNDGEVRVLIGTSAKMAEGLNVQKRVVAIHHPTVSYKPSDLEQSDARGIRKGNINDEVHIYRYLQEDTFDSHKWQAIDRKGEMINNALRGDDVGEIEDIGADEDGGADVDPAMAMAITSGNPLVKAKIDIDKKVDTLRIIKQNYQSEIYRYQDIVAKNPQAIKQVERRIANVKEDIALRDKYGKDTKIIIKDKAYEKQTDANKALNDAIDKAPKNGTFNKIGEYNGFGIMFKGDTGGLGYVLLLKGANDYEVDYSAQGNTMARFAGVLNRFDADLERLTTSVERMTKDLETARQEVNKPFEREEELSEALAEQKKITYDYEHYSETQQKAKEIDEAETGDEADSYDKASADDRWKTTNIEQGNNKKAKKDVSLDSIVKKIRTKFGIPIATGKVNHKEARGVYKKKAEVIRTRITNNLPTISHELGHHLDKLYELSKKTSVAKLIKAMPQEFLALYKPDAHKSESIAEFVRTYLKSTTEAQKLCPEFYNDFVTTLSKEDLESLNEIASDFNYYLSMTFDDRVKSAIVKTDQANKPTAKEVVDNAYTNWIDSFYPIKQAVDFVEEVAETSFSGKRNAYVLATNSLNASTIAGYLVSDGFRDLNGDILEEMSFKECIKDVKAKDLDTFGEYLVLKHSLELIKLDMRVFADDTLEDIESINKAIDNIEKNHPEMVEASENLYQYQRNLLKYYLVDGGLLTESGFNTMVEKFPCYVPFYRAVSKGQGKGKGTFANQFSPIKRIKGSGAPILNPLESIVRNTEKFVKVATKNQVMQVLAEYADGVEGFGQFIEKVNPDMLPHGMDMTKYKEKFTNRLQQAVGLKEYFAVTELLDEILNDTIMDFTPKANASKKLVTVMKYGSPSYYQIHDEALYKAVAEMSTPQLEGALKVIGNVMLPMKMLMTQLNPLFASSNLLRDIGTAYKHSAINNPIEFANQYLSALKAIVFNDRVYQQYKAMGGGHSTDLATDIDQIKRMLHDVALKDMGKARRLAYSLFVHPVETVTSLNDIVESIPRVMEFARSLAESGDLQEAIYNADDITTNFKRKGQGNTAKIVNKLVFFNNASLQGLDKTRRSLTGKDWNKKLLKWVLVALVTSAMEIFWNKNADDEGYGNLSSYIKNNFYNFAIGDGKFISLPKPRETAILDSFTARTMELVFGNEEAFYDFGGYLAQNLLPPMLPEPTLDIEKATHDVLGNTVLGGIVDIGFNQDFLGRPIESQYEQNYLESHEIYNESTSKPAYWLGQTEYARTYDLSPKKIDHLLSSYLGIIGSAIQNVFPMNENRQDLTFGLRNRFIKDSAYSTDVINKLWENTDKAEAQFKYNSTVENAIEYEQNAIVTNFVSQMSNAIYALPLEEQREARKYLLKVLNGWNYETTTAQEQMKLALGEREIPENAVIDSLPKSLYEWTENKQKYSYQMTPKEYEKFVSQYLKISDLTRQNYLKTASSRDDYIDKLGGLNSDVMKEMRKYYNKAFKSKATKG